MAARLAREGVAFDLVEIEFPRFAEQVGTALDAGHRRLVAAGGDGTVNALAERILALPEALRREVRLGAIGLGSSNDFHKPFDPDGWLEKVPVMLADADAAPRAAYRLETDAGTVHYLMNSSIGLIARGNRLFNRPPLPLRLLQRLGHALSVSALTLFNVLTFGGVRARIRGGARDLEGLFLGVTMLKTPHIAGNLYFKTARSPDDGLFDVVAVFAAPVGEIPGLMERLAKEGARDDARIAAFAAPAVELEFPAPTDVEYDGETLVARRASYRILPGALRLMGKGRPA